MDKRLKKSEQLTNTPENVDSSKGVKKKASLDRFKKFFISQVTKTCEASDIERLINQKKFDHAVKELIVLENKVIDVSLHKTQDIDFLYEILQREMSQVIEDSIVKVQKDSLIQVIRAIKKREKEDSKVLKTENKEQNRKTQRKFKEKWRSSIEASVSKQMSQALSLPDNKSGSGLSQKLYNLGKTFKIDLIHVVKNLRVHYPEDFNVCNLYAQRYHKYFVSEIGSITEYELDEEDTYFLLCWIHNIYPKTILRDPAVQGHIDESKLESLLPPRIIRKLEKNVVKFEVNTLEALFEKSLNSEVKRWKDGKEPTKSGRHYKSNLQTNITQMYHDCIQRAEEISEEMCLKMAPHLGKELQKFLQRFQNLVVEYTRNRRQKFFRDITSANINCSREFRKLLEDKGLRIENRVKDDLNHMLCEFETCIRCTFERYVQEAEISIQETTSWKGSETKLTGNLELCTIMCYSSQGSRYIRFSVVLEYVTRLLKNPVRFEDPIQLRTVARQMTVNATRINGFFSSQKSQETWLYPLLEKLAEIIELENLPDVIHKISEFAKEYTDIGIEHISAILHIKGNIDRSEAASAVEKIIRTRSGASRVNSSPLFSLIKPFSSQWLYNNIGTKNCPCITMYAYIKFFRNKVINFWCKNFKIDTPPTFYPHNPRHRSLNAQARRMRDRKWNTNPNL